MSGPTTRSSRAPALAPSAPKLARVYSLEERRKARAWREGIANTIQNASELLELYSDAFDGREAVDLEALGSLAEFLEKLAAHVRAGAAELAAKVGR